MPKKIRGLSLIGCVLGLLYGTSVFIYAGAWGYPPFRGHAMILAALYLALAVCALGVAVLKEWARRWLVLLNALAGCYLLVLWGRFPDFVQSSYIFMHIAMVLFFVQRTIKVFFRSDWTSVRKSILVVDDDPGILQAVKGILLPNGYSVLTASTGEKGVQIAKLQRPDLILLDVILPGLKGRDVCSRLKEDEHARNIPVIFLTAKDSPDDIRAEKEVGGISHLTKPVNAKTLLAEIKKVLG